VEFDVLRIVAYIVPMLLSLTVHEYAHARAALWLGDDTASMQGRLTLNPLAHIDPVGTLLMPILAQLGGGLPLIGWAKPVPVNPVRFTRRFTMHAGMALTAAAGPLSNLLLVLLAVVGLRVLSLATGQDLWALWPKEGGTMTGVQIGAMLLMIFAVMNAGLAIFNLLPIPPLDGSRLLPRAVQPLLAPLQYVSYFILMGVMFFAGRAVFVPVRYVLDGAFLAAGLPTEFLTELLGKA
jgi:Zn-dependent protease